MKKRISTLIIIAFLIVAAWMAVRFVIGGDEDSWLCVNNQWIRHGNPAAPMPQAGCGR